MAAARLTRKEKQEQTRAAVLASAATLFAKHGYEGTSMEAIARHAGLTQGAIYSNFASKADLWWALADYRGRTVDVEQFLTGDRPLRDELADLGRAVWRLLQQPSRLELLLAQEFDLFLMRNPRDRAKYDRAIRAMRQELADALEQRRGALPMPAGRLATAIDAAARGLLHTFMLDRRAVDEDLCVAMFTALAR